MTEPKTTICDTCGKPADAPGGVCSAPHGPPNRYVNGVLQSTFHRGGVVMGPAPNLLPGGGYQPRDRAGPCEPPHQGTSARRAPSVVVTVTADHCGPLPSALIERLRAMILRGMAHGA